MTLEAIADTYAGQYCTLDGAPAVVTGREEIFATVVTTRRDASAEFSWLQVRETMREHGGRFQTAQNG